jgi:hypothetical protein
MKSRKEILEGFHDQALGKLLENKINLGLAESRVLIMKPGEEYDETQKTIISLKKSIANFEKMIEIIELMIHDTKK